MSILLHNEILTALSDLFKGSKVGPHEYLKSR